MKYDFIISGEIGVGYDWWTGQRGTTAQQVRAFLDNRKDEEVHIAVSSPGGHVDAGLEIYQAIVDHGNCHMHIIGMTASAATFLCMGAKSVDMVDGSLMLIHPASTLVAEWTAANKTELDSIIARFQKDREDLDTIDKVIASLYAKRCGKSVEDCIAKMEKAAWLTAEDAKDFGLIDEIRDDAEGKCKKRKCNLYTNAIFKEYGLPPFPQTAAIPAVVDENGEPSQSFLEKTVEKIKAIFHNEPAQKSNIMKKFTNIMAVLAIASLLNDDKENVLLNEEQATKIDDHLASQDAEIKSLKDKLTAAETEKTNVDAELKKAQDDLKAAQTQIENLKKAPGADTSLNAGAQDTKEDDDVLGRAKNLFDEVKDI